MWSDLGEICEHVCLQHNKWLNTCWHLPLYVRTFPELILDYSPNLKLDKQWFPFVSFTPYKPNMITPRVLLSNSPGVPHPTMWRWCNVGGYKRGTTLSDRLQVYCSNIFVAFMGLSFVGISNSFSFMCIIPQGLINVCLLSYKQTFIAKPYRRLDILIASCNA